MIRNGFVFTLCALLLTSFLKAQIPLKTDSLMAEVSTQSPEMQINTYNDIADLLLNKNPEESFRFTRKSWELALALNDKTGQENACINFGWYYMEKGKSDSARYFFRKALETNNTSKNFNNRLNAMTGLSNVLSKQMKSDSAILVLNQAIEIAEKNQAVNHLANIYAVLGNVYSDQGRYDTAMTLYFKAKNYYQEDNNQRDLAVMLNNMAILFNKFEKYDEALELLKQAIEINTALNDMHALIQNISNAALCYKETGQTEKAIDKLLKNIELAKEHHIYEQLAVSYNAMANNLLQMKEWQQARRYLDSSLVICRQHNIDYGLLVNQMDLGSLFQATGQTDSALVYLKEAKSLAEEAGLSGELSKIWLNMFQCYKIRGNYDSALYCYENGKALEDTLRKVDVSQKLAELEGKYQQEKNQKIIAELNVDLYKEKARYGMIIIIITLVFAITLIYLLYKRYKNRNRLLKATLLEKEKEKLETDYQNQQKELAINALHLARMNEMSYDIAQRLKKILMTATPANRDEIRSIITHLKQATPGDMWKEFETRFEQVHQSYYRELLLRHPQLTPNEVKICSLMRLNLSSKDIATLTHRSVRTIETNRNHIRKKLNLSREESLTSYLLSI